MGEGPIAPIFRGFIGANGNIVRESSKLWAVCGEADRVDGESDVGEVGEGEGEQRSARTHVCHLGNNHVIPAGRPGHFHAEVQQF